MAAVQRPSYERPNINLNRMKAGTGYRSKAVERETKKMVFGRGMAMVVPHPPAPMHGQTRARMHKSQNNDNYVAA